MNGRKLRNMISFLVAGMTLVLVSCADPFQQSGEARSSIGTTGTVMVNLKSFASASLVPDIAAQVDRYRVTLSRDGFDAITSSVEISDGNLSSSSITLSDVPAGSWNVLAEAISVDGSTERTIGQSSGDDTVMVTGGEAATVSIPVYPTTAGSGIIDVTINWTPSSAISGVDSAHIVPAEGGPTLDITDDVTVAGGSLSYSSGTIDSGQYILRVQLKNASEVHVATVIAAVHVYDNVTTTGTIELTETEIARPPAAPTSVAATEQPPGSGTVVVTWTDNTNVEEEYSVHRSTDGGTTWNIIATVDANGESYTDSNLTADTTYRYRVSADNTFGSSSAEVEITTAVPSGTVTAGPIQIEEPATAVIGISSYLITYFEGFVDESDNPLIDLAAAIDVEPQGNNDTDATAVAFDGESVTDFLIPGDSDIYTLEVPAGADGVTIYTTYWGDTETDTYITVRDGTSTVLAENDDDFDTGDETVFSRIDLSLAGVDGPNIYIEVTGYAGAAVGGYSLVVEEYTDTPPDLGERIPGAESLDDSVLKLPEKATIDFETPNYEFSMPLYLVVEDSGKTVQEWRVNGTKIEEEYTDSADPPQEAAFTLAPGFPNWLVYDPNRGDISEEIGDQSVSVAASDPTSSYTSFLPIRLVQTSSGGEN